MTDGNICSSDVWRQISDAQSAVGKLKRKRERCRMERLKFIGKRLVYLVIMLFGVATLAFYIDKTGSRRSGNRQSEPESIG